MLRKAVTLWSGAAGAQPLLLDSISSAAAFSVRKLRTAYAGACLRVRRSSDNAEQDIGFASGVLDTASLLSFCGAGDGFVKTWYDQSGNGNNVTTATQADQPAIATSGAVLVKNAKPALQFNQKFLLCGSLVSALSGQSLAAFGALALNNAGASYGRILAFASGASLDAAAGNAIAFIRLTTSTTIEGYNAGDKSGQVVTYGAYNQLSSVFNGTQHIMYLNGAAGSPVAATDTFSSTKLYMGDGGNLSERADFNAGEFIVVNASVASTRTTIEASQKGYFGTP